jgi:hypothetical protein
VGGWRRRRRRRRFASSSAALPAPRMQGGEKSKLGPTGHRLRQAQRALDRRQPRQRLNLSSRSPQLADPTSERPMLGFSSRRSPSPSRRPRTMSQSARSAPVRAFARPRRVRLSTRQACAILLTLGLLVFWLAGSRQTVGERTSDRSSAASSWLAGRRGGKASMAAGASLVETVDLLAEEVLPQLGLAPTHKTVCPPS